MEIKEIEGSLDIAREISNKLFRRVGFLNELGVSKEERIKHIEETLELYQHGKFEELCDALFNALEVDKHKRECNNYREIVENIISQEESSKSLYIYHIYALRIMVREILKTYIICSESCKELGQPTAFHLGSGSFFKRVSDDISCFITQIKRFLGVKGGSESYLGRARICSHSIGEAIRELAYKGTNCEGISDYLQQGAVILIRHYIEVVIKEKYEEIYGEKIDSKIELYKLLRKVKGIATGQDKTEQGLKLIKAIFKDDDPKEILAHIETLHVIRNWANKFVHENKKHLFFWEPQIVYKYLLKDFRAFNFVFDGR